MTAKINTDLIERRVDELGLAQSRASTEAGAGKDLVRDILRQTSKNPGIFNMIGLARVLEVTLHDLLIDVPKNVLADIEASEAQRIEPGPTIPALGEAAAGVWHELDIDQETPEDNRRPSSFAFDPRFKRASQYAITVRGPSLNRKVPDGAQVHCVSFADLGIEPKSGQYFHVIRFRDGGSLRESTIKKLILNGEKAELWPDSDDPNFQEPIVLDAIEDGDEVRLAGLVIRFQADLPF